MTARVSVSSGFSCSRSGEAASILPGPLLSPRGWIEHVRWRL